ncbi:MAG: hypothetical protein HY320_00895 [Armatimonadetes bacterium]|nr:hypothetical protein [Armatimonadota bacterium]
MTDSTRAGPPRGGSATEELQRYATRLRILAEASHAFAEAATDYPRLLRTIVRRLVDLIRGYLFGPPRAFLGRAAAARDGEARAGLRSRPVCSSYAGKNCW